MESSGTDAGCYVVSPKWLAKPKLIRAMWQRLEATGY